MEESISEIQKGERVIILLFQESLPIMVTE